MTCRRLSESRTDVTHACEARVNRSYLPQTWLRELNRSCGILTPRGRCTNRGHQHLFADPSQIASSPEFFLYTDLKSNRANPEKGYRIGAESSYPPWGIFTNGSASSFSHVEHRPVVMRWEIDGQCKGLWSNHVCGFYPCQFRSMK